MDYRLPLIFMLFCMSSAFADFSNTKMWFHPLYIEDEPFILDFRGEWPTDCHPGEQKPVIREYTGDSVLIEFETTVEHVTCNEAPTPYRVLVDMSDVVDDVTGDFRVLKVTIRFNGSELTKTLDKQCTMCDPPPPPRDVKPEPGLYGGEGLERQGILLARQNDRMGVYPLIYDESGNSQWLFGGGGVVEDVYFVKLKELSGGQCLGCPPPDDLPQKEVVGKLSMLMDSEGVIQVKVNDGLFKEYRPAEFGYGSKNVGGHPERWVPDLSGRWAFVVDADDGPLVPPPDACPGWPYIPDVFDIVLNSVNVVLPPIVTIPPPTQPGSAIFSIQTKLGDEGAQMECSYDWTPNDSIDDEFICYVSHPDVNDGDTQYEVRQISIKRLMFEWVGPILSSGTPVPRIAVRVD